MTAQAVGSTVATTVTHYFAPRGAVKAAFESREREVILSGPAGTGKSRGLMEKLHIAALKYPGMRGLIIRKTAVTLTTTALVTWNKLVTPEAQENGTVRWYGGSQQEPAQYIYSNGSRIVVGGLDNATKIMSSEYDLIYVQEAIELTITDWENLTTRLRYGRMPYQQLLADTNPGAPTHWLKQRCDEGNAVMLYSRHEDNPRLFDSDSGKWTEEGLRYLELLDALTGVRKARLRYGRWVAAEGVIYEEWDPDVHHIEPFDIPEDWPRYWVVDFGYKNPFVLQWWAEDHDGRLYLYRELYYTKRLVEDHARQALDLVSTPDPDYEHDPEHGPQLYHHGRVWHEPRPRAVICDHDAEDKATLEKHLGMGTKDANKTVSRGLQLTQARFRVQADGKPRIFFLKGCRVELDESLKNAGKPTSTVEEIPAYIWEPDKDGRPSKDQPRKEDDHGMDDMRYMVAHRDIRRIPRVTGASGGPMAARSAHGRFTKV